MGNLGIIEIILLAVLAFAAFGKSLSKDKRNAIMIGVGALFLVVFFTGGLTTPGTPLSISFGGMNFTNVLILSGVAIYLIRKKDDEVAPNYKPIMIGLLIYMFFSAASSPSNF